MPGKQMLCKELLMIVEDGQHNLVKIENISTKVKISVLIFSSVFLIIFIPIIL